MTENLRIFKLLMQKNLIVRKRHWKMILFVEISIPVFLFLLGQLVRMLTGAEPINVTANSTYPIQLQDDIKASRDSFQLRFTPDNYNTRDIMNQTQICMGIKLKQVSGSITEEVMLAEFTRSQSEDPWLRCVGVVFNDMENATLPKKLKYKVRVSSNLPEDLYDSEENGRAAYAMLRDLPELILMQMCLDESYITTVAQPSSRIQAVKMSIQQMPYPPYIKIDTATQIAGQILSDLARLAFLVILCVEVTFPANEKYIGINILMSVNGVKTYQNLLGWIVSGVLFSIIYLAPMVIILKYFLPPTLIPYLALGNSFIVWIALTIHCCHVITFGIHMTAYLWKPSHGVFFVFMFTTIMGVINNFSTGYGFRRFEIYLGILSPNFLLSRIFDEINSYEARLVGVQWSNIFTTGNPSGPPESCIGVLVIFSLLGIVAQFFMALYVYAVRPGKYGVAQNPFFCLQKGNKVFNDSTDVTSARVNSADQTEFEKVAEGTLAPGIQIRELKKAYITDWFRRTTVHALKGISVDFYKGQITALLGHNGAGKTTMMSILAGLTGSSEGMVFIDGKNVQYEAEAVRGKVGLCPQENMVFPDLNVFEQILFFGMLKAKDKTRSELEEEVNVLLGKVNLVDKKNSMAKELSGGQKRRMCLAMAVIGDASVLILDEPTSGMDAESKREVWDIILKMRGEKTILISTHDMEEADILGDRIAIIHSGKMRSYGTSMFLKKLYGDGQVEVTLSIEPSCDPRRIIDEIGVNAQLLSQDEGQAVLAIPFVDNLPEALDKLEAQKKTLGVTGISVSIITLEQVFLKVTREEGDESDSASQAAKTFVKVDGMTYLMQCCYGYVVKKLTFTRKNPWTFIISMLLPSLSAILMVLNHTGSSKLPDPISVNLDAYPRSESLSWAERSIYNETYAKSAEYFGGTAKSIRFQSNLTEALLEASMKDLSKYRNRYIVSGEFRDNGTVIDANGFYSGTALLGIPATINMLSNAIVKALTGDDDYTISMTAQKLPESFTSVHDNSGDAFSITMAMIVFIGPAVALYVTQPLQENLASVKQLQFMTGASSFSYWLAIYLMDLFGYIISVILLISMFVIADAGYGTKYYYGKEIMIFFLLLFMFGASVLPLVYLFSFWKKSMNTSINLLSIIPIILSFLDFVFMGLTVTVNSKIYDVFREIQSRIFLLFPHLSLIYGHASFFGAVVQNGRCRSMSNRLLDAACISHDICCEMVCRDGVCLNPMPYFTKNSIVDFTINLSSSLLWMTGSFFLYFAMIFILEQNLLFKMLAKIKRIPIKGNTSTMDELVKKEEHLVSTEVAKWLLKDGSNQNFDNENVFLAHEVSKCYGNLQVVKGISFRVKQGECFGLLGVNGAGKSTTFRMLTGSEIPHSGAMVLNDYSLGSQRKQYLAEMGYCPQHDAMIDTLNAYDHLYLFARLRGIPRNEVKAAVEKWILKLNLTRCAAQPSGTYSGGNKRRLNIAMALIGNPTLVLMDEPTTGVDPAARRSLWTTLKTCQEGGQSIILTSHSMEECEALCNRLVIMVKGQLVCVGASQELKHRFGAGYNIHVKLNPGALMTDVEKIKRRIETTLQCKLSDENTGFIGYHVTDPEATWTIMYTMMNELKNDYPCIEDFAVLSSTLEQLFIQFARAPGDTDEINQSNGSTNRRWWQRKSNGSPV